MRVGEAQRIRGHWKESWSDDMGRPGGAGSRIGRSCREQSVQSDLYLCSMRLLSQIPPSDHDVRLRESHMVF